MPPASRLGDVAQAPVCAHSCPLCPHVVSGPAMSGSPDVRINKLPALRVGDMGVHSACCGSNNWEAAGGSGTVKVNGKPLVRKNDATRHCGGMGRMMDGSETVQVGG